MAYFIDSRCTDCGDCIPACPTAAIQQSAASVSIQRPLCVECLGYSEAPSCVEACPAWAIVPDSRPWFV
jgi:Fe-S-cluster-containing hydrogenase component 2